VLSDFVDCARGLEVPAFGVPATALEQAVWAESGALETRFYLRLMVRDCPGVLADVSSILRDQNVSVESMLQRGHDPEKPVSIIMTSHHVKQADFSAAAAQIEELDTVLAPPVLMRIEDI